MSAAALLLSAVGAYAAQQKYYFLYEEGHEDQPETSWFILDREAKKYIPDSCGDDELTVKNYKKSGNTETFDCYDNSYFTHSVIMRKNDKGQTVVQISYEKVKQTDVKSFVEPRLNMINTGKSIEPKTVATADRRRHRTILWTKPQKRLSQD